jgi:ABC-type uncharacterized transport system permease subunit
MNSFFDRLSAGWTAGKSCLEVLRNDKKLIVFPILSGLSALVVFLSFVVPLAIIKPAFLTAVMEERHVDVQHTPIWFWIVTFLFYFCNYFVIRAFMQKQKGEQQSEIWRLERLAGGPSLPLDTVDQVRF